MTNLALQPADASRRDYRRRSIACIQESGSDVVFDRCPLDILGYLVTHRDAGACQIEDWMPQVRQAVAKLDVVVFVPVEAPDRVDVPRSEARLRSDVDTVLSDIIVDDACGLEIDVIVAAGTPEARLRDVMAGLHSRGRRAQPSAG